MCSTDERWVIVMGLEKHEKLNAVTVFAGEGPRMIVDQKARTASPCDCALWIQSIFGRRLVSSIGPVAPTMNTGARSQKAL